MTEEQQTIESLENLIKSYASSIDKLSADIALANTGIKEILANDDEFREIDEQIKALQKKRIIIKKQAMARQNLIEAQEKLKDLKKEKKEKKQDLSEYLLALKNQFKVEKLKLQDNKKWGIKESAKLVKLPKVLQDVDEELET